MFASEWILGLFSSVIPVSRINNFFTLFFKNGWIAFYKFVLFIFDNFKEKLLEINDECEILVKLKNDPRLHMNSSNFELIKSEEFWDQILNKYDQIYPEIDEEYIAKIRIKYKIQ